MKIAERIVWAFVIPVLLGAALCVGYDFIVPPDPNLIRLPNGIVLTPYEDYGPRDIDVCYRLLIIVIFALGFFLPLLIWFRTKQRGI